MEGCVDTTCIRASFLVFFGFLWDRLRLRAALRAALLRVSAHAHVVHARRGAQADIVNTIVYVH